MKSNRVSSNAIAQMASSNYGLIVSFGPNELYDNIAGEYTGSTKVIGYSFYWGTFNMKDFYTNISKEMPSKIQSIYVLEKDFTVGDGGYGQWVHAELIDYGQGTFLAFAKNQVITINKHAGLHQYTVIPVKGITIP